MLPSGRWSWLIVDASGRPLVSVGSDMADEGGDRGIYLSKAMGPGEIGGSSVDANELN